MPRRSRQECRVVFQYVMACSFVFNLAWGTRANAQTEYEYKWTDSAGSLTIFQPGDAVRIHIWELFREGGQDLNLSNDYPINMEGFIIMPLIAEVKVVGLTSYELMKVLEDRYRAYLRDPYIYVRPLIRITMQGAFNQPGSYRTDPSASLWDLVALAGGPNARCDLKNMRVERGGEIVMKKVLDSFERGYSLDDVGIRSGDQIVAPVRSGFDFRFLLTMVNLFASITLLYMRLRSGVW